MIVGSLHPRVTSGRGVSSRCTASLTCADQAAADLEPWWTVENPTFGGWKLETLFYGGKIAVFWWKNCCVLVEKLLFYGGKIAVLW